MAGKQMTKQGSQEIPHIQCAEDILLLSLRQLSALAKSWVVDVSGLGQKKDIEEKLIKFWMSHRKEEKSESWELPYLASVFKEHQKTQQSLIDIYLKAERVYNFLAHNIKWEYNQYVCALIKERKESLISGECTIVIAGEAGAGKTSLLNLILETQIFPVDSLKCTNTILEIRSSEKKDAIFYYKQQLSDSDEKERKVPPKIISLKSLTGIQEFKDCVAEYDQSDGSPYDRCEVFYPFETLSTGVVIVDTPGVEGGFNVDQRLQIYLSRAFGFIYVINTNIGGGVQQSRLGHLLKTVVNSCQEFNPEASLFIANKWDNVPVQDHIGVKQDIFYKLNQVYPGVRETQIHYMSVKKSGEFNIKFKIKLEEHKILMSKVFQLVLSSLRQGMMSNYCWLSSFLSSLSRTFIFLRMTMGRPVTNCRELVMHLDGFRGLQKKIDESIARIRIKVEYEIKKITADIQKVLQDRNFIDRICNWEDNNECPKITSKWMSNADAAAVKISEKISRELDGWQRKNGILRIKDNEFSDVFSKELGLMDVHVKRFEDYIRKRMRICPRKLLFAKKKLTLGCAVSCIGMLDTNKRHFKNIFKDFNDTTKAKKMSEAAVLYIETILTHKEFSEKLRRYFDRSLKDIEEAATKVPGLFFMIDLPLVSFRENIIEFHRLEEKLSGLVNEIAELLGQLDIFYINDIMKFDFELSELEWKDKKELGSGSFAKVYKSTLTQENRPVAIKVATEAADQSNATQILTEDRIIRDLKHANIVRYYGASYIKTKKGLQWIMVMELCQTNLKQIYTGSKRDECMIPGCLGSDHPRFAEAAKYMLDHATQICTGLDYIHGQGYTHRNMKPENVLLAEGNVIKITDVGVTKVTHMLCKTANGSPAYMAPELLLSRKIHTNRIDIYSFSLIFWEMWFGKDVANEINKALLWDDENAMEILRSQIARADGWRPPLSSPTRPPEMLIDVLKRGWASDPGNRPSANEFGNTLKQFLKNIL